MITKQPTKRNKPLEKKLSKSKEGKSKDRKRSRDQSQKKRELPQFIPPYERLLPIIRNLPEFKWPAPIQTNPSQRNESLWCNYHRDHGHETDKCWSLKFMVEKLIKAGHLRRYIREIDHRVESGQPVNRVTTAMVAPSESRLTINYILAGPFDN